MIHSPVEDRYVRPPFLQNVRYEASSFSETQCFLESPLSPADTKEETRIPWECWNLLSPLGGHIGAKLHLERLDMSLHRKNPREF